MNNPVVTVSVIIPVYNGEADLPELLQCLEAQTYPRDQVEYWLVDNNSSDRTASLIQAAAAKNPTLHYWCEAKIQSSYAARNTGIKAAKGEIFAFTDADCRPQPDWLANLIEPFTNPKIGIVAGEILPLPGKNIIEQYSDVQETLSQKHTLIHPFCPYGQTANLAVRRQGLEKAGLFRPYLTTGGDADLCWRVLRQTDYEITLAANAIIRHRHRQSLSELASQWRRYGKSNLYLHELHGIDLMRELNPSDYAFRLTRWLLKEIPRAVLKTFQGKALLIDFVNTPLSLFTITMRSQGQRQATLPEKAREIDWL